MPLDVNIDDLNTTLISYQGEWEIITDSTRQWDGGVHGTVQPSSSATFNFRGYEITVWGTIPAGVGSNLFDVSVDGNTANTSSLTSNGSARYNEIFYSAALRDTYHQIVVTNRGSNANGNTEFLLDRFEFVSSDDVPVFTPTGSSLISGATASASATTITTSQSKKSSTPLGAIAGAVIGALVILVLVLGYLLWRRRKNAGDKEKIASLRADHSRHPPLTPTPFPLQATSENTSSMQTNHGSNPLSEKSEYRSIQPNTLSPIGNTPEINSESGSRSMTSSTIIGSSTPQPEHSSTLPRMLELLPPSGEAFDHPPPSYWNADTETNASAPPRA